MNVKMFGVIAVAVMMMVPLGIVADDADATTTATGTYSVYAFNGSDWSSDIVYTYDAAMAVQNSAMWVDDTDSMVAKYTPGTYVTYNNTTYGDITTFMGLSADTTTGYDWIVLVYVNGAWQEASVCLGSYKCFSDYNVNYRAANIILYYGSSSTTVSEITTDFLEQEYDDMSSETTVSGSDYAVTFALGISYENVSATISGNVYDRSGALVTDATLKSGTVYVTGYGSDAYLALINAVGAANFSGTSAIPGSGYYAYGWMDTLFGLGTVQTAGTSTPNDWTDDSYAYWIIYDSGTHMADFVLGAYSPLDCAGSPFAVSTITLSYDNYTM